MLLALIVVALLVEEEVVLLVFMLALELELDLKFRENLLSFSSLGKGILEAVMGIMGRNTGT
jgi:hypothetical protein